MTGNTWFGSRGDRNGGLTLTGQITGNYSFTKVGPGLITLTNTNNAWTGSTYLNGGVLRVGNQVSLSGFNGSSNTTIFNGGILELNGVGVGISPQQPWVQFWHFSPSPLNSTGNSRRVNWQGSGGFSAFDVGRVVAVGGVLTSPGGGVGGFQTLQWGVGHFVPIGKELLLSSRYANAPITLANGLNAGGAIIRVERGLTANAYAIVSGRITAGSEGFFTKKGLGLLNLSASTNNYSAQTIIEQGALGRTLSSSSNITLRGGVMMLNGNFTRNVGTAAGQIQWDGGWLEQSIPQQWVSGGGFAAWSGDQIVKLNNSTSLINWGSTNFVQTNAPLKFGHYTASGTVIWDKELSFGNGRFQVERGRDPDRADVLLTQSIQGAINALFSIIGDGRMDIAVNNPDYKGRVQIYGAELRLHSAGELPSMLTTGVGLFGQGKAFDITAGGILTLDNRGSYKTSTGGWYLANRLPSDLEVSIDNGGHFRLWGRADYGPLVNYQSTIQSLSRIITQRGAITIDLTQNHAQSYTQLQLENIVRISKEHMASGSARVSTSTLNLTGNVSYRAANELVSIRFSDWGAIVPIVSSSDGGVLVGVSTSYEINDSEKGDKIIPWATVNGQDWVTPKKNGSYTYLIALPQYYTTMNTTTWDLSHNISVSSQAQLDSTRTINSLRLIEAAKLDLRNSDLILNSGGLLSYGQTIITSDQGRLMGVQGETGVKTQRPFYAHIYKGSLEIAGRTQIYSDYEFVKTGDGTLLLSSPATHYFGKYLYINQGTLSLKAWRIQVGTGLNQRIYIGDYSGIDILELPADSWDPIIGIGGRPSIHLLGKQDRTYGARYDYADAAILRMGGNTKLHLDVLSFEGNAIIDWYGGEVGKANILWVDLLLPTSGLEQLVMRNWYQYEDIFLVRKDGIMKGGVPIIFEGYEDFPVLAIDYDANYWQITPFHAPEPSTYGAILGAVGLGLWGWRRKRKRSTSDN